MNTTCGHADSGSGFRTLGLDDQLVSILENSKLEAPTEIQQRMVPLLLEGKDCLTRAFPGAGKTNAYILPIVQKAEPGKSTQALVLQPTRSLAQQLEKNFARFAPQRGLKAFAVTDVGCRRPGPDPLAENPEIIITTPRGADQLLADDRVNWDGIRYVVVDELDAMVAAGDLKYVRHVLDAVDAPHQTIVISSQLTDDVRGVAVSFMREPVELDAGEGADRATVVDQYYFEVQDMDEAFEALLTFCKQEQPNLALIVTNSPETADNVAFRLDRARVNARALNGGGQRQNRRGPMRPRNSRSEVVVASDPATRQLSVIPASHLVHYEIPADLEGYLSRLRNADRLRRPGVSIAIVPADRTGFVEQAGHATGKPMTRVDKPERPADAGQGRRAPRGEGEPGHREREPQGEGRGAQGQRREGGRGGRERPRGEGGRREGGSRRDAGRANGRSTPEAAPAKPRPKTIVSPSGLITPLRWVEALHRDAELEALGLNPLPRTLGCRFRAARSSRAPKRPPRETRKLRR